MINFDKNWKLINKKNIKIRKIHMKIIENIKNENKLKRNENKLNRNEIKLLTELLESQYDNLMNYKIFSMFKILNVVFLDVSDLQPLGLWSVCPI